MQAWESCCEPESRRDALTVQAEQESSGSAAAAIRLLRSATPVRPLSLPLPLPLRLHQDGAGVRRAAVVNPRERECRVKRPKRRPAKKRLARTADAVAGLLSLKMGNWR